MTGSLDYDRVARDYDRRYASGGPPGVARALRRAAAAAHARRVLEVGCGTGQWLGELERARTIGVDRSKGMLARARSKSAAARLIAADAHALPFEGETFDLVACVHALHHFGDPARFVERAARLLRPGGALLVIGLDPNSGRDRWYLYDYFPESLPLDLERYPAHSAIRRWMQAAGLVRVTTRIAERIQAECLGVEVLADPILHRNGTSQLTMIERAAFDQGMARLHEAAHRAGEPVVFTTDLALPVTRGFAPR